MHGLGNDFMVVDAINQPFRPEPDLIRGWADRFGGVGFDQMLIVEAAESTRRHSNTAFSMPMAVKFRNAAMARAVLPDSCANRV